MPPLSTGRPKTSLLRASQTLTKREVRELATPVLNHIISDGWASDVSLRSRGQIETPCPHSAVRAPRRNQKCRRSSSLFARAI